MKKKGGKRAKINPYADLEGDVDHYDVEESDDELGDDGRIMLDNAKGRKRNDREEEVFKVYLSSEEDEDDDIEEDDGIERGDEGGHETGEEDSDLEDDLDKVPDDDGDLPDAKAWGSKRRSYYDTDYVDKDFIGFDDEEAALLEEQEANEIQKRIISQLEQTDFSLGLLEKAEDKKKEIAKKSYDFEVEKERVEKDLTKLSKQELIDIIKRETPGFFGLIKDCKMKLKYLEEQILPILEMETNGELPECEALTFLQAYRKVINYYVMNTTFFIMLKCKREKTDGHPVVKRLGQIATYLGEMDNCLSAGLGKQIEKLLTDKKKGLAIVEKPTVKPKEITGNRKQRRKMQQLLKEKAKKEENLIEKKKKKLLMVGEENGEEVAAEESANEEPVILEEEVPENLGMEVEEDMESNKKRAATYKMLKNKGLTPRRKKEVRNPRVRNRNKFKKAVIRRKGQVREVRKEIHRYDGELSGIKKNLSKSIKLK